MSSSLTYRPELDGLRALGMVSVLIFHTTVILEKESVFFSGGFLGIDMFFVISGYLITLIILREINAGTFTFTNYFKRRAKRLFPVLFFVLLVSIPFAWWLLYPAQILQYRASLISSILFYSNFQFWSEDPYLAHSGIFKPLLHTWTLAVEEQYYLLIPLIILSFAKFWRGGGVIYMFALLFIFSFAAALYQTPKVATDTYYLLPYRFWEMAAGCFIAAIEFQWGRKTFGKFGRAATAAGLIGLLYSFYFVTAKDLHPHWITLLPILSTTAIIWFSTPKDPTIRLLSSKPFVGLGVISYSVYLWHYPIFSFGRSSGFNPILSAYLSDFFLQALYISMSIFLAILSYRFVELPFRYKEFSTRTYVSIASLFFLIVAGFSVMLGNDGAPERFYNRFQNHYSNQVEYDNKKLQRQSWQPLQGKRQKFIDETRTNVLFIGDSHSKDLFNAFYLNKKLYPNFEFMRFSKYYEGSEMVCAPSKRDFLNSSLYRDADIIFIHVKANLQSPRCSTRPIELIKTMKKKDSKRVVLFSKRIIFENPPSNFPDFLTKKLKTPLDHALLHGGDLNDQKIEEIEKRQYSLIKNPWRKEIASYKSFAKELGIEFVDITPIQCDFEAKRCDAVTDEKKKIYYDRHHWTTKGAKHFGKKIFDRGLHPLKTDTPPLK